MILKNGRVMLPDEDNAVLRDIRIQNGVITDIGLNINLDDEIVNADGLFILPGGIDPHVHFDDPGFTSREDFYHGTSASASGGVTTVIDMPCTSIPPVTSLKNLETKLEIIKKKAIIDFALFGGVSGAAFNDNNNDNYEENIKNLAPYTAGFKTYFVSGMKTFPKVNHYQFKKILEEAAGIGKPVLLHAEDNDYISAAAAICKEAGDSPLEYYKSRPESAEILAALAAAELSRETGGDLHIVHIGTADIGDILKNYNITGETGPLYLEFDIDDFIKKGSVLKVTPPVKQKNNKKRLWELLKKGTISFVASDHAPCSFAEKNTGSIWSDYAGYPGSGTLIPYMFSEGYLKKRITLKKLTELTSYNAACRYKLNKKKGSIEKGKDGDLILIDPEKSWKVEGKSFFSKGKITPFEGKIFKGKIIKTILRGSIVYDEDKGITGRKGFGRFITPE